MFQKLFKYLKYFVFIVKILHLIYTSIVILCHIIKLDGCRRLFSLFRAFHEVFMELMDIMEPAWFFFRGWIVLLLKVVWLLGSFVQFRCLLIAFTCLASSRKFEESVIINTYFS